MKLLTRIYFFAIVIGLGAYFFLEKEPLPVKLPPRAEALMSEKIQNLKLEKKIDSRFFEAGRILFKDYRKNQKIPLDIAKLSSAFANNQKNPQLQIQIDAFDAQDADGQSEEQIVFQCSLYDLTSGNKIAETAVQF